MYHEIGNRNVSEKEERRKSMKIILDFFKKIPAGIMIIPFFIGAIINTFFPQILNIGSYTTATFSNAGAATVLGVQLVCLGSRLRLKELPIIAKRGGVLLASKLVAGILAAIVISPFFGQEGILGISLLAIVCAISNTNGSIYLSLMSIYGDEKDAAAVPIIVINNGPFFAVLILGITGLAKFSWIAVIAALLPLFMGMVIGNLSKSMKNFLEPGIALMLPFIGFTLGAGINLKDIFHAGISGIVLAFMVLLFGSGISVLFDKIISRRPGYAGVAASATGANAVAVPAVIGMMDASWQPYVERATVQVAAAVVVTAIIIPFIVKRHRKEKIS